MHKFNIAGILIEISADSTHISKRLKFFSSNSHHAPDLKISISICNNICKPEGKIVLDEGIKWLYEPKLNKTYVYKCRENSDEIISMLSVDNNWSCACITYIQNDVESKFSATETLCEILFRNTILYHQGFVLHASAIEWNGKGMAFSAPSGTGKTTHTALWKRFMGAKILNDDRPAIRVLDNRSYVYGTPWSGSSSDFSKTHAPLSAIILLEQDKVNSIELLTNHELLPLLIPRCFLPYHDSIFTKIALNNIEKVLEKTPVYLLKCRPDKEAVELVYECIK